jgi:hypothetical protein
VGPQRGDLAVEGVGDIDVHVGLGRGHDPDLADGVGLVAGLEEFRERERVAGVRVHRAQRRLAGGQVVRMTGEDPVPQPFRALAHDAVGPDLADHPGQVAPQVHAHLEPAVGIAEEDEVGHAHFGRRRRLFGPADTGDLAPRHGRVEAAGIAVGHDAVGDLSPGVGPGGDRSGHPEIDIVGVSGDHQDATGRPVLEVFRCGHPGTVPAYNRYCRADLMDRA